MFLSEIQETLYELRLKLRDKYIKKLQNRLESIHDSHRNTHFHSYRKQSWNKVNILRNGLTVKALFSTRQKNVIEETGERCNENSSWRGCTPLHTSKVVASCLASKYANNISIRQRHRYTCLKPLVWIRFEHILFDVDYASTPQSRCIDLILYRYPCNTFYILCRGKRYWKTLSNTAFTHSYYTPWPRTHGRSIRTHY